MVHREINMETTIPITPITIEHGMCPYCDRRFVYASSSEINNHINIPRDTPFPAGLVYVSQNGFNIIIPEGRLRDGTEFGGYLTHTYQHWVSTSKRPIIQKLEFDDKLKARGVRELRNRFEKNQIRLPTLTELSELQYQFGNYLADKQTNRTSQVWKALKSLRPEDLTRRLDSLFN